MVEWRKNKRTKKPFAFGPSDTPITKEMREALENDPLHPYVARPSIFEPVLTTGQKLTPLQKKHLEEEGLKPLDEFYNHLVSVHGDNLPPLHYHSNLDPQVAERFGIPTENTLVTREMLTSHHLRRHIEDIEERTRTAPKTKPLTAEEYREAGVDEAPGQS